jgi:hypothetical protein
VRAKATNKTMKTTATSTANIIKTATANKIAVASPNTQSVSVEMMSSVNGVLERKNLSSVNATTAVQSTKKTSVITNAAAANALTLNLTKSTTPGYDQTGSVNSPDVDTNSKRPNTVSITVKLVKGMTYDLSYKFTRFSSGTPTAASLVAKSPTGKSTTVNLTTPSFTASESGNYTLVFAAGTNAWFDGKFDTTVKGKALLPPTTGDANLDALLQRQNAWWHDAGTAPTAGTVPITTTSKALAPGSAKTQMTYTFMTTKPATLDADFPKSGQAKSFSPLTDNQKAAALAAFNYISAITNVKFTEDKTGNGNIQMGRYDMSAAAGGQAGMEGIANLPNNSAVVDKAFVFINSATPSGLGDSTSGSYGWAAMWHELGHAMGLKHPGNYDAGGSSVNTPFLPTAKDNHQYSIMSYKDNGNTKGANNQSYMLYDVAALQYLYGVNDKGSTAVNGAFKFSNTAPTLSTIYSAKGTDRIDLTGITRSSVVNLNAGTFSSINQLKPNSTSNTSYSGNSNVSIAFGSKINNIDLSTSNTADTVILNAAYKSNAFNAIKNFQASDKIGLSSSVFGNLTSDNIDIGVGRTTANTAKSKILVDSTTGSIFYDADANGKASKAVKVAQFTKVANMTIAKGNFSFLS